MFNQRLVEAIEAARRRMMCVTEHATKISAATIPDWAGSRTGLASSCKLRGES